MKLAMKTAAVAVGILVAGLAAGCGAAGPGTTNRGGGAHQASVPACAAYGVQAIEHRVTVTWMPPPCRGLSRSDVNQAVALAIQRAVGGSRKAAGWRRRAARAAVFLSHLITGPVSGSPPPYFAAPGSGAASAPGGRDLAMDVAALIAWLAAAGSGAYVLSRWLAHGGSLRQRADTTGTPPAVIIGHFGLALSGLVIWVAYLIAGLAALAWVAVGVLLPVAGLGMAALAIGLPGRLPVAPASIRSPRRRRLSPLFIVGHGAFAVTAMLLVLLAAIGTAAS